MGSCQTDNSLPIPTEFLNFESLRPKPHNMRKSAAAAFTRPAAHTPSPSSEPRREARGRATARQPARAGWTMPAIAFVNAAKGLVEYGSSPEGSPGPPADRTRGPQEGEVPALRVGMQRGDLLPPRVDLTNDGSSARCGRFCCWGGVCYRPYRVSRDFGPSI